jgi:catechol 2,3-dioxygenase-like lactoylglutathione lyase family enzyme
MTVSTASISRIGLVVAPVSDQERALAFYTEKLGLEKRTDVPFGPGSDRWIEVAPPGAETTIAIVPPRPGDPAGTATGICFQTDDIDALHADLLGKGVDADAEVMRMGDPVPPMFFFRDPDGNTFFAVQTGN